MIDGIFIYFLVTIQRNDVEYIQHIKYITVENIGQISITNKNKIFPACPF